MILRNKDRKIFFLYLSKKKMKSLFSIFALILFQIVFSQEGNEVFSSFDFEINSTQKILSDKTKLRESPNLNAIVLDSVDVNQDVKIISRTQELTKIGERNAPWFRISYSKNGIAREGYVFGGNIALGHRKYKDIQFLFGMSSTQKIKKDDFEYDELVAKIIALQDHQVIAERSFGMGNSENLAFYSFKISENPGLKNVDVILQTLVSGEACGIPTYEQYFLWTNHSFYPLPKLMNVGDADVFWHSEEFSFQKNGKIILKTKEYEKDENEKETTSEKSKTYFWDGESLK